jgi:hypothetical protein
MERDDDEPDAGDRELGSEGGAVSLLIYERGSTVVERWSKIAGKLAHAGVGTMYVGGHTYDTFERLDGYVALKEGTYVCKMEISPSGKKMTYAVKGKSKTEPRKQLRPLRHGTYKKGGGLAAILVHPGAYPSSFIGCIGVGRRDGNELKQSVECMLEILDLCGGFKKGRTVQLTVRGTRPATPSKS